MGFDFIYSKLIIGWLITFDDLKKWLISEFNTDECVIHNTGIIDCIPVGNLPAGWLITSSNESYIEEYNNFYLYFDFKGENKYSKCVKLLTEEKIKEGEEFVKKFGITESMIMKALVMNP